MDSSINDVNQFIDTKILKYSHEDTYTPFANDMMHLWKIGKLLIKHSGNIRENEKASPFMIEVSETLLTSNNSLPIVGPPKYKSFKSETELSQGMKEVDNLLQRGKLVSFLSFSLSLLLSL